METRTENERLAIVENELKNLHDTVTRTDRNFTDVSTRLETKLDNLTTNFATVKDFTAMSDRVARLEGRSNVKSTIVWVGLVASILVNMFMVYQLLTPEG